MRKFFVLLMAISISFSAYCETEKDTVAILVDSLIYKDIQTEIDAYVTSVEAQFPVELLVYHSHDWKNKSFRESREFVKDVWEEENIDGVILVGYFPMMLYQVGGQGQFPMVQALGYEDLDGEFKNEGTYKSTDEGDVFLEGMTDPTTFTDAHGRTRVFTDTIYDRHYWGDDIDFSNSTEVAEKVNVDIWCAVIRPYQAIFDQPEYTDEVINQLKSYFKKCERYSSGNLPYQRRGFVQSSSDWGGDVPVIGDQLEPVYGLENTPQYKPSSSGIGYMRERAKGMEVAYYYAHSASWFHQNDRGPFGTIYTEDLVTANGPGSLLTLGFNCHGADFIETPAGCLGQHYVFEGNGLTFVGNTISTGFPSLPSLAAKMASGKYLGQAFKEVIEEAYVNEAKPGSAVTYNEAWGNIIIGNPFIWAAADKDLSHPGARITGTVSNGEDLLMTFYKGDNIYTTAETKEGVINVTKIDTGDYRIVIETINGQLLPEANLSITEVGQQIENWNVDIPQIGPLDSENYYLKVESTRGLPEDWRDDGSDLSNWKLTDAVVVGENVSDFAPFVVREVRSPDGNVYIRKHFTIYNLKEGEKVYVYSAHKPSIYVNGNRATVPEKMTDRSEFSFFQNRYDITPEIHEGLNYFIAKANDILHVSSPIYQMSSEPSVTLPLAPLDLTVVSSDEESVQLSWTDNSENEDGFIVERKNDGREYELIAYLGKDVTTYNNEDLELERFFYRVSSFNYEGTSSFSNEVFCSLSSLENSFSNAIGIYPNPASDELKIMSKQSEIQTVQLLSMSGSLLKEFQVYPDTQYVLDVKAFKPGIYFLSTQSQEGTTSMKLVIK